MRDAAMAAAFQHIAEADEVGVDIGLGMLDGVAYASLSCEMDHMARPVAGEDISGGGAISQGQALEAEAGMAEEPGEAGLLEAHVIIGVEIVDADDFLSHRKQPLRDGGTDEAGRAGNEDGGIGEGQERSPDRTRRTAEASPGSPAFLDQRSGASTRPKGRGARPAVTERAAPVHNGAGRRTRHDREPSPSRQPWSGVGPGYEGRGELRAGTWCLAFSPQLTRTIKMM